jgi:hypothetical protein
MNRKDWEGKRYICSVRASDSGQAESSTDAQLAMLNAKAEELGMVYVDKVVLEGVTGSMPGRREDLLALIERKKTVNDFDVLVLQRIDRLTRGGADHGFWFEHECKRAGIALLFVGDDIPEGRYASLIKVAKYEAAQEQAFSISQRSTQGAQLALEQGRNVTSSHTPYACWRLYLNSEGKPSHIIRDLKDGRQEKLDAKTHAVIDTYGQVGGGGKGHYHKQKGEKVLLMPGDPDKVQVVREIYRLHFLEGWGGKRIADLLNAKGIPSPQGKQWSQHQVEVIYEQEVYTGRSVGNRTSSAIYHERQSNAPKAVNLDPAVAATAKNIPVRHRPREEWFVQNQPLMAKFLEPEVRKLAMAEHEKLWARRTDPDRPKQSKSRHKASDYLLSGLLLAKQDGGGLVGVLCGRVGKKVRYYRHKRGRTGYRKGSVFNRLIPVEPLETAVVGVVQEILADLPNLRERVMAFVREQSEAAGDGAALEDLRRRREQVRRRTELIVSTLDEETLADARAELERLRAERRSLDEQIASAEAAEQARTTDPEATADRVVAQLSEMAANMKTMPKFALRQALGGLVEKVVVDMETKEAEVTLALPAWAMSASKGQEAMRLVGTSASSTYYQTHQRLTVVLAVADCRYVKGKHSVCFDCRRRKAA